MDRLPNYIDPDSFKELVSISLKYEWLLNYNVELAEMWNLFNNKDERELLEHLFSKFVFITSKQIREISIMIRKKVVNDWQLQSLNTFVVATSDDSDADGSQALLQLLKREFGGIAHWKETNFKNSIASIKELPNNSNILLLDDFIGSGKTARRRIQWVKDQNIKSNKTKSSVYFLSMAGMKYGVDSIQEIAQNRIFVPHVLMKGISDLSPDGKVQEYTELMDLLENKLGSKYNNKKIRDFKFGYNRSEALYSVEAFSTPNNVFPVFWWPVLADGNNWRTIFKRL